ncbi:protein IMPACT isoform X2 [Salvelinus fontinalis]|uniref:protein IMPACT isoform X2 n=1 Tax=Salvelinus fontinalis TaxID=8038 RepID=UPI0024861320|nr:protein IMPACT isoform X2 [Salvelinus fontinalis]
MIILPHDYPSAAPPVYQINAAWLRGPDRKTLSNSLEELYVENTGESILYLWVEKIREFLLEKSQSTDTVEQPEVRNMATEEEEVADDVEIPDYRTLKLNKENVHLFENHSSDEELPPIKLGETITERRSTFQPHLAPVVTPRQVRMVLDKLFENKKIASATHNIYAYRIYCEEKQSFLQDCEDDGETAAGGRLLHLLQILDVRNVLVVVSRWYGGILLGPDRFKHINNSARNILVQEGYTSSAVKYRAQRSMTHHAVVKMVAVWVLAFLLYGPAIIFWELVVGKSIVPPDECFAEFYCTWYFLLSASTFEFFTPFISVTFFNLCIYLNIQRRNKSRAIRKEDTKAHRERGSVRDGGATLSVFFVKTRKVSSSEPTAVSEVIEEDEELSPSSCGEPSSGHTFIQRKKGPSCRKTSRLLQFQAPTGPSSRSSEGSRLSRDKKIAKSLAIIVCIFGICWAPYTLLMIIRAACSGRCVEHYWYEVTFWLLWLNSGINPFLYPLCHSSFRRAFAKILCPKRQSVQPHIETQSC